MNDSDYTPEQLQHLAETMPDKVRIDDAGKIHSAGLTHRGARDGRTLRVELRAAARRSGRYGPGFGCPLSFDVQEVKAGRRESAGVQWVVRPRGGGDPRGLSFSRVSEDQTPVPSGSRSMREALRQGAGAYSYPPATRGAMAVVAYQRKVVGEPLCPRASATE